MKLKIFKDILKQNLLSEGFVAYKNEYYYYTDKFIFEVSIQKSNYSNILYINYGILLLGLISNNKYPKNEQCHFRDRVYYKKNDTLTNIFDLNDENDSIINTSINEFIENIFVKIKKNGLKVYLIEKNKINLLTIEARRFLKI